MSRTSHLLTSKQLLPWVWPVLFAGTVFYVSGKGQVAGPDIDGIDKVAHFAVYGLLATLLARIPRLSPIVALLLASFYGMSDEYHQSFIVGRSADIVDWCADTLGAAMAVFLYSCWSPYRLWLEAPVIKLVPVDT